jgi:hypothetical protein
MLINNWTITLLIAFTLAVGLYNGHSDASKLIAHEKIQSLGSGL